MDKLIIRKKILRQQFTALANRCGQCFETKKKEFDQARVKGQRTQYLQSQDDCYHGCELHKKIREVEDELSHVKNMIHAYKSNERVIKGA
ncbi:hypothetical protein BHU72_11845 [Desulfuribacillus stibiiarsenatis]|uniref:Uncharacterized protein n=1 Tax=Desulfuribacillus stibiiarsenatis TaxID=1390249 RepID=A0A1E5L7V8_9FIRM|nr:hypothetical protein [Desulfuribacillus stibiiarsenatis]OEH86221.1 hypothetical protein BHU72_11845 [Desulfuribacillus stibiiarsenatis]